MIIGWVLLGCSVGANAQTPTIENDDQREYICHQASDRMTTVGQLMVDGMEFQQVVDQLNRLEDFGDNVEPIINKFVLARLRVLIIRGEELTTEWVEQASNDVHLTCVVVLTPKMAV